MSHLQNHFVPRPALLGEFFTQTLADVFFYRILRDSKSPQVSSTLLSILADLRNTIVWMASTRPLISKLSSIFHHHHHHTALVARISLTLSRHSSLSFIALGRSSGQHPVSSHSCWMYVHAGRPALHGHVWGSIRVHLLWVRPCFSSSVLHVWLV